MWRRCHRFPLCIGKVCQLLSALGLHVACLLVVEAFSVIVALCFLGRFILCIVGLVLALDVHAFACVFALFALAFALRVRSELPWHRLTVGVLLCSRDIENLLSHLIPACDSDAVQDEMLFNSHVLHSQHRHSYLDVVVYGLCGLVLVVAHGSLERHQLGWNVVSESVTQHVHQESDIPRPKLGLPTTAVVITRMLYIFVLSALSSLPRVALSFGVDDVSVVVNSC